MPEGRQFKAAQMGGPSGGCVPAEFLDLPIDYDSGISLRVVRAGRVKQFDTLGKANKLVGLRRFSFLIVTTVTAATRCGCGAIIHLIGQSN